MSQTRSFLADLGLGRFFSAFRWPLPGASPPLTVLRERVEAHQRQQHSLEKKLMNQELEKQEQVDYPAELGGGVSLAYIRLLMTHVKTERTEISLHSDDSCQKPST
ncbi:hypothetical protein DNTS_032237 [Danionella cerebrum]|uniref:Uncharacterized protein n=1 Tax=Danionella cerebrum TaxID=2873325 RepID=A0A553Q6G5_9TELE|nr:hypothetical protein DNTS_032237 [Danionella translucida]